MFQYPDDPWHQMQIIEYDHGVHDAKYKGRPDFLMKWSKAYKDGYESVRGFGSFDRDMYPSDKSDYP